MDADSLLARRSSSPNNLPLWSPRLHPPYNHRVDDMVVRMDYNADVEDGEDCFGRAVEFLGLVSF